MGGGDPADHQESARRTRRRAAINCNGNDANANGGLGQSALVAKNRPARVARRKKRLELRRRQQRAGFIVFVGALGFCLLIGVSLIYNAPDDSSTVHAKRELDEILLSNSPLTEENEQRILDLYGGELNRFPVSIGLDTDSPNWESIEHPAREAMKYFEPEKAKPFQRKPSKEELAAALSGKQLRGGNEEKYRDDETTMRVPRFWNPHPYQLIADEREKRSSANSTLPRDGIRRYLGNFGSRLMTPHEAKSIGSVITSKDGKQLETIFLAIASYRDYQCSETVESAFARATHPERIRVTIVDQTKAGDEPCSAPPRGSCDDDPAQMACKFKDNIDYLTIDAALSVGPVFARHLGHRMYRGEYFAAQSDAHVSFVNNWDGEIITQWHQANNEMAVLSTYLSGTDGHIDLKTGERVSLSRPIMCESDYEGHGSDKHLRHGQQPEGVPLLHEPVLDPFWAAGFSFARGHFVVNVPYDQHLPWIFQGEEISIGLRGFSYGYDYYSPEKSVSYHHYGREDVPMFWENSQVFRASGEYGMNRLNAIIQMTNDETKDWIKIDLLKYGIGKVRPLEKFFQTFGIHTETQSVERNLCKFVGRPMQKEFIPSLRRNGMGLDYDKITYRFVNKWKN
mmetsp:Transcript_20679/g.48572  ORF Transcript_20679/g.48572 Transcript_20679/m.48572 type:complete len:625 (-) Transcript_20679:165-2039(-)